MLELSARLSSRKLTERGLVVLLIHVGRKACHVGGNLLLSVMAFPGRRARVVLYHANSGIFAYLLLCSNILRGAARVRYNKQEGGELEPCLFSCLSLTPRSSSPSVCDDFDTLKMKPSGSVRSCRVFKCVSRYAADAGV